MDLRGASADAVAGLGDELETHVSDAAAASTVADELFSVAVTLRSEGALRRFATDGSAPKEAKQGLVDQVFGSRVSEGTIEVLRSAVARRWTATRDLADALEHLSLVAHVNSAEETGRLADELFGVARTVKDNPELRDALSDPSRSASDKAELVDALFGEKTLPATVSLVKQALTGSYRTVSAALAAYEKVAADVHGQRVATVRVARELTDEQVRRLTDALSEQYGRPVHLNLLVDPSVLGGMRVEIGDDVIDGTVSSRLDDARRRLAG